MKWAGRIITSAQRLKTGEIFEEIKPFSDGEFQLGSRMKPDHNLFKTRNPKTPSILSNLFHQLRNRFIKDQLIFEEKDEENLAAQP